MRSCSGSSGRPCTSSSASASGSASPARSGKSGWRSRNLTVSLVAACGGHDDLRIARRLELRERRRAERRQRELGDGVDDAIEFERAGGESIEKEVRGSDVSV